MFLEIMIYNLLVLWLFCHPGCYLWVGKLANHTLLGYSRHFHHHLLVLFDCQTGYNEAWHEDLGGHPASEASVPGLLLTSPGSERDKDSYKLSLRRGSIWVQLGSG